MRRRPLFTLCSALSLLLCVAVCVLWVRSYVGNGDVWDLPASRPDMARAVSSRDGSLLFMDKSEDDDPSDDAAQNYVSPYIVGFGYFNGGFSDNTRTINVLAPHWFFAAATAILPTIWFLGAIRSRRRCREGLCVVCGYDLWASPDRCPECGAAASSQVNQ